MTNYFEQLSHLLSCIYDNKPNRDEYIEIMYVLNTDTDLTIREVGHALSQFLEMELVQLMNDVYYSASPEYQPVDSRITKLRNAMTKYSLEQDFDWTTLIT